MNFAKRELFKYGWKEGKGLGKESTGTVEPVRPKLKFDNKGLGFNYGEEYSFKWWEHVYDQAANNISVISAEDGTKSLISTKYKKSTPITTQKKKSSRKFKSKKKDTTLKDCLRTERRKRDFVTKVMFETPKNLFPII
ncbi:G patch domain-containing protein 4 isoform X3 [Rhodnius prolixus]|uniref:G patch domain-containing protein 4 isoform X3 n=1 Tax=Rhodnius prolixus TaxID=13249 RepID=UPI003D18D130